jgi:large subunit ribosomal protein L10
VERKAKQVVVEDLGSKLKRARALFLAEYSGMNVAQMTRLRRELQHAGAELKVTKNTLLRLAASGTDAEVIRDQFTGPNAVICSYKDPAAVAKLLSSMAKEMPFLKVKSGVLGRQQLGPNDLVRLAALPSREVLLSKLLGVMQAPPQRLVGVLAANLNRLMWTLSAIKTQKEAI